MASVSGAESPTMVAMPPTGGPRFSTEEGAYRHIYLLLLLLCQQQQPCHGSLIKEIQPFGRIDRQLLGLDLIKYIGNSTIFHGKNGTIAIQKEDLIEQIIGAKDIAAELEQGLVLRIVQTIGILVIEKDRHRQRQRECHKGSWPHDLANHQWSTQRG